MCLGRSLRGSLKFRLECHANETSRFIHALWLTRKKKYCLVFPEGKGFREVGPWEGERVLHRSCEIESEMVRGSSVATTWGKGSFCVCSRLVYFGELGKISLEPQRRGASLSQNFSETKGLRVAKLLVGGSWLFLLCYLAVVGGATKGVGSCSGAQKWGGKGVRDGREADGFGFSCKDLGAGEEVIDDLLERAIQKVLEEGEEAGTISWSSSCLAKFSRCIGMPMEGFEWEILTLLKRMKERKDQKGKLDIEKVGMYYELYWRRKREGATFSGLGEDSNAFLECKRANDNDKRKWEIWTQGVLLERNRGGSLNLDMKRFFEVIKDLELEDMPLLGAPFTWSGGCVLLRPMSDHFSILLDGGGSSEVVVGGDNFSGSSGFILAAKLKALKSKLKEWNIDVFGRVEARKDLARTRWTIGMLRKRLTPFLWRSWKLEKK
ncbi:hypothetical protein AAG906_025131 [Vitis piasezkii]